MQRWWIKTQESHSFNELFAAYVTYSFSLSRWIRTYLDTYLTDNSPQSHCENISHLLRPEATERKKEGKNESICPHMNRGIFPLNTFHYVDTINVGESPPHERIPDNLFHRIHACFHNVRCHVDYLCGATTRSMQTNTGNLRIWLPLSISISMPSIFAGKP